MQRLKIKTRLLLLIMMLTSATAWADVTLSGRTGDVNPSIGAFRAYFELTDPNATVREFKLNFGGETTGIVEAVANSQLSTLNSQLSEWYDMQGRKVSKPTKAGMYIHGNRKVVIK